MHPDTNSPTPIDPQLTADATRLTAPPLTVLPTRRARDDGEPDDDEGERNAGSEKRQKLNLWKCKQCREARKKCFPSDRVWPQKCDRCIAHRPDALECSEPELNTRKRGPNRELKDKTRDKDKDKNRDKSPQPPTRAQTTASTSETLEPDTRESTVDDDDGASTDGTEIYDDRPKRTEPVVPKVLKEPLKRVVSKENYRPPSCYPALGGGEFRILKLAPGSKDNPSISCSFVITSVNASPTMKYEAISYLWGASKQTSTTIELIDPQGKPHSIFIRTHVYDALKALRHSTKIRFFWVDALCINYGSLDQEEKNTQTAMKRYVFRNAANICFWLGEDEDSKTALKFIPQTLDLTAIDELVHDKLNVDNWVAFVALLKNPAFGRLWLVQEVAVATNVTLHSGSVSIHYQDLVDAVAIFKAFRNELCVLFHSAGKNCKDLFDRKITITERFIEVSVNSLRVPTTQGGKPRTQRLLTLEELVSYLSELKASNLLDRIYSVLAIARDGPKLDEKTLILDKKGDLKINYEAEVVDVFQFFVLRVIENSRSLDIICRYWADKDKSFPTWVLPLQSLQPQFDSDISERTEAESLVGLPDHNYYHASRGTSAEAVPSNEPTGKRTLTIKGFHLDTIAKLAPRASEGIILYEWLALGGCKKEETKQGTIHIVPESFWRTLVADRGPKGTMPPSWYSIAFKYCLLHLTSTGDINTNRLIRECEDGKYSLVVSFLQRVQSVIWNRKFLVSETNKWIGLAPTAAEPGDKLVILHGCSVPVVLRPVKAAGVSKAWYLVGECYVHGMMDGEATDPLRENKEGPPGPPDAEEFIIR